MHKMLLLLAAHLAYARSGKPSQTEDGDWGELSEACDDKINVGASTRTLHCIALHCTCVCALTLIWTPPFDAPLEYRYAWPRSHSRARLVLLEGVKRMEKRKRRRHGGLHPRLHRSI